MKKRIFKKILISVAVIYASIICHLFYSMHESQFNNSNDRHIYIFKESALEHIHKPSYSWVTEKDVLTNFIYYKDITKKDIIFKNDTCYDNYYIGVWEFKTLKDCELDDVFINKRCVIGNSKFILGETLDGKGAYSIPIRYLYKIDGMIINLGMNSKVLKDFQGVNYKGFYGLVDVMSICNRKGVPQIFFNFKTLPTPTVLLLYKGHNSFFLIKIHSDKKIDENVIDILDLK